MNIVSRPIIKAIYQFRRALPLYADDRSKIYTVYAKSLLAEIGNPALTIQKRTAHLQQYMQCFSMPVSIYQLGDHLIAMDDGPHLFRKAEESAQAGPGDAFLYSYLAQLAHYIREQHSADIRVGCDKAVEKPKGKMSKSVDLYYIEPSENGRTYRYRRTASAPGEYAAIILFDEKDLAFLSGGWSEKIKRVSVYLASEYHPSVEDLQKAGLSKELTVDLIKVAETYAAPYSVQNRAASAFADALAAHLVTKALNARPQASRLIPPKATDEIVLRLSDVFYRPVQRYSALCAALDDLNAESPIVFLGHRRDVRGALLRRGRAVYCAGDSSVPRGNIEGFNAPNPARSGAKSRVKAWRSYNEILSRKIAKALPQFPSEAGKANVLIAGNLRAAPYKRAVQTLKAHMDSEFRCQIADFQPPFSARKLGKSLMAQNLYLALSAPSPKDAQILAEPGLKIIYDYLRGQVNLGYGAAYIYDELAFEYNCHIGSLMALLRLYKLCRRRFSKLQDLAVLLVPGREAAIRIVSHAAEACGHFALDVQVLFVSDMPRYRRPAVARSAVIDEQSAHFYQSHWQVPTSAIDCVGSLQIDQEVARIRSKNRKVLRRQFGLGVNASVVTYGIQPIPEAEIFKALDHLCDFASAHPRRALCVKLHPRQTQALQNKIKRYIQSRLAGTSVKFAVLRKQEFADVLAITDCLITYYSNIGLSAAGLGIPVLSLPLDQAGDAALASRNVTLSVPSFELLPEMITQALAQKINSTFTLSKDSDIRPGDGQAAQRISTIVRNELRAEAAQK